MSRNIMSCVRDNSPPLEMTGNESNTFSLSNNNPQEQQKRRRFHPLRNLRRIFRRRSVASVDDSFGISSTLPGGGGRQIIPGSSNTSGSDNLIESNSSKSTTMGILTSKSQFNIPNNNRDNERIDIILPINIPNKINSSGCSNSTNFKDDSSSFKRQIIVHNDVEDGGGEELAHYQRSLSEGTLGESELCREGFSQSHDSVFSESATPSSLSNILKAELIDVLKRRNRSDASDEDLGLPCSPSIPHHHHHHHHTEETRINNDSEMSSLSLLSVTSSDLDDDLFSNVLQSPNKKTATATNTSGKCLPIDSQKLSTSGDFEILSELRLSHSAAKHKMAIRPKKKKPSNRRSNESTILPTTPEVNEDNLKVTSLEISDFRMMQKIKSLSLPPDVNAKVILDEQNCSILEMASASSSTTNHHHIRLETADQNSTTSMMNMNKTYLNESSSKVTVNNENFDEKNDEEEGFFKRLLHRNSKKNKKKIEPLITNVITTATPHSVDVVEEKKKDPKIYNSQEIEEKRREIKNEIQTETKMILNFISNDFMTRGGGDGGGGGSGNGPRDIPSSSTIDLLLPTSNRPKSGPAARQRVIPQNLTNTTTTSITTSTTSSLSLMNNSSSSDPTNISQYNFLKYGQDESGTSYAVGVFDNSDSDCNEISNFTTKTSKQPPPSSSSATSTSFAKLSSTEDVNDAGSSSIFKFELDDEILTKHHNQHHQPQPQPHKNLNLGRNHFDKKFRKPAKIIPVSSFQQKISKSHSICLDNNNTPRKESSSLMERKTGGGGGGGVCGVEKSKSFRHYSSAEYDDQQKIEKIHKKHTIPSLPNLSQHNLVSDQCNFLDYFQQMKNNNNRKSIQNDEQQQKVRRFNENKDLIRDTTTTYVDNSEIKSVTKQSNIIDSKEMKNFSITIAASKETPAGVAAFDPIRIRDDVKIIPLEKSSSSINYESIKPESLNKSADISESKIYKTNESVSSSTSTSSSSPMKSNRNTTTFEKPNNQQSQVPEFMKIQLNKIESGKQKSSHLVFSKNVKDTTTNEKELARRFSNENVEITDSSKSSTDLILLKRNTIGTSSNSTSIKEESNRISERKSLIVDEKYEHKIEDPDSKECIDIISNDNRKSIGTDEVVLRKKSSYTNRLSSTTNVEDNTPELMKVFARRSLKIKDTTIDEVVQQYFNDNNNDGDDDEDVDRCKKSRIKETTATTAAINMDSDKENQLVIDKLNNNKKFISNSEHFSSTTTTTTTTQEEIRIQSSDLSRKSTTTKLFSNPIIDRNIQIDVVVDSKMLPPSENMKRLPITTDSRTDLINDSDTKNNNINRQNNNYNNKLTTLRQSKDCTTNNATLIHQSENREFKGILQRRAEWEKRVKEALK